MGCEPNVGTPCPEQHSTWHSGELQGGTHQMQHSSLGQALGKSCSLKSASDQGAGSGPTHVPYPNHAAQALLQAAPGIQGTRRG